VVTLGAVERLLSDVKVLNNIKEHFQPLMTIEQYKAFHGV
jgi:hypothetical protein